MQFVMIVRDQWQINKEPVIYVQQNYQIQKNKSERNKFSRLWNCYAVICCFKKNKKLANLSNQKIVREWKVKNINYKQLNKKEQQNIYKNKIQNQNSNKDKQIKNYSQYEVKMSRSKTKQPRQQIQQWITKMVSIDKYFLLLQIYDRYRSFQHITFEIILSAHYILFSTILMESSLIGTRTIVCYRHKNQIVTHICTDCKCTNSPILCIQCLAEQVNKYFHYDHQKLVVPLDQALQNLCFQIKTQVSGAHKLYKTITSKDQYINTVTQIQKGSLVYDELDQRINSIKSQMQLELELLLKQFQKSMLLEKQEYFKMLDNYKKTFVGNVEYLRNSVQVLLDFNNFFKYYSNKNNFYLKIVTEARKKTDWLMKAKKNIQTITKNLQNSIYQTQITNVLNSAQKVKFDIWPVWKGEQNGFQRYSELKSLIKKTMTQWLFIPQMKNLEDSTDNDTITYNSPPLSSLTLKNYSTGSTSK